MSERAVVNLFICFSLLVFALILVTTEEAALAKGEETKHKQTYLELNGVSLNIETAAEYIYLQHIGAKQQ